MRRAVKAETQPTVFFLAELKYTLPLSHQGIEAANYAAHHHSPPLISGGFQDVL